MRLVVTGRTGQVSRAIAERAVPLGVDVITIGRPEFDLNDPQAGLLLLARARPDAIVSAAAYTAVDKAEDDQAIAMTTNAEGPGILAGLAAKLDIPIIHLSTDYVFDGTKPTPYIETDAPCPINIYGQTKLDGERAVVAATTNYAILRTAWVYSPFGRNFVDTMLRFAAQRAELRIVDDQKGNPTSAFDIADAVIAVARNLHQKPNSADLRGVFHAAGSEEASWAGFACEIFAQSKALGGPAAHVKRITTAEFPTRARRPPNSRLSCEKIQRVHGVTMPAWPTSLRATLNRLLADTA